MTGRRTLMIAAILFAMPLLYAQGTRVFTYELNMPDVDTVQGASRYPTGHRPSLIGFKKSWTAAKRLPFKIGPGIVRAYTYQYPEQRDRKHIITIGAQTREVVIETSCSQYHAAELVFELKEATDLVKFRAETVDGKESRMIWYKTIFTNDPDRKYVKMYKGKHALVHQRPVNPNPAGNLLPNSGFEEGICRWDVGRYRSGVMVKPSLLSRRAAHGNYSIDVGKTGVTSRWFTLKGDKDYSLSIHTAPDNVLPITVQVEVQEPNQKPKKIADFLVPAAKSAQRDWRRSDFKFKSLLDEQSANGRYRLVIGKGRIEDSQRRQLQESGMLDKPLLVDSVQIVEGGVAPYEPYRGLEAGFVSTAPQALVTLGGTLDVSFNLLKAADVEVKKCSYTVYDYFDSCVREQKEIACTGDKFSRAVALDTSRAGFHRVRTRIDYSRNGKLIRRSGEFFYNVVHPSAPRAELREKSLIGGYFTKAPIGPQSYSDIVTKFGFYEFNTLGHVLMRWKANSARNAGPGNVKYDWRNADREIEGFRAAGISIALQFHVNASGGSYGIPKFAEYTDGEYFEFRGKGKKGGKKFSARLWLDYVKQFAGRYKGKFSKYVIQDEPMNYFTPEQYARFYLATYKAIKEVDQVTPVFYDAQTCQMRIINALNAITGDRAYENMDGVHVYLSSRHSGMTSSEASAEFRRWVRSHKIPVVTATCFSSARRLDRSDPSAEPFHLGDRDAEAMSVQYLLDGVVWGGSNCYYYYYAVHPGRSGGIYLFDDMGRVKPLFHFYSAANRVLGGFRRTESVDDFANFRIGIVEKDGDRGVLVMYSLDGKIYDFSLSGAGVENVLDAFGNPVEGWRKEDKVQHYVSRYPVYLVLNDVDAVRRSVKDIAFSEKIGLRFAYSAHPEGVLQVKAFLECNSPLSGVLETDDVFRAGKKEQVPIKKTGDNLYTVEMPLCEGAWRRITRPLKIKLATNFGDISAGYAARYAAITRAPRTARTDGVIRESEWPSPFAGRMPLHGYFLKAGRKRPMVRGYASLAVDKVNLRGMVEVSRTSRPFKTEMVLVPVDLKTGRAVPEKKMEIVMLGKKGLLKGQKRVAFPVAFNLVKKGGGSAALEFRIPLSRLPDFKREPGSVYAFNVTVRGPESSKKDMWYLDAAWHGESIENVERWGQVMIVE